MFSITCKLLSWSLGHNWSQLLGHVRSQFN